MLIYVGSSRFLQIHKYLNTSINPVAQKDRKFSSGRLDPKPMGDRLEYKPPWFALQVIGLAGPSASGKTSVSKALVKKLNVP